MENRYLEQKPRITIENIHSGKVMKSTEKYIGDHFPWRDFFVGVQSLSQKALGKWENNGVYFGRKGYLLEKFQSSSEHSIQKKFVP